MSTQPRREATRRRLASLGALSAAGLALTTGQEADAELVVVNVNQNVGFAPGNLSFDILNLSGTARFGIATTTFFGFSHSLFIAGTTAAGFQVRTRAIGGFGFANPLNAGVKFGTAGGGVAAAAFLTFVSSSGSHLGPGLFTDKYYAFSYRDTGQTRYGWVQGSLTNNTFANLSYHITRYAYETTGVQIATGQTTLAAVPEPATASLALLGSALVAGASGVRRWKKAKADEAA